MKKTLCFILALTLLLTLGACGQKTGPVQEPTTEPDPEPAAPLTPEERAVEYLHSRDRNYVKNNLGVYIDYYRLTHPGAVLGYVGYSASLQVDMYGADAEAFGDSGLVPDFVTFQYGFTVDESRIGTGFAHGGWPEANLLLEGLPENVASAALGRVLWPDPSYEWRLTETRNISDRVLARILLGDGAEYDTESETYRAEDKTLDLSNGAQLDCDTPLARALVLTLPQKSPDTLDPRDIPTLEEAGWKYEQHPALGLGLGEIPFLERLYSQRREQVTLTVAEGQEQTFELINAGRFDAYRPDLETLNARLAAALEEERARLGEAAYTDKYGDLAGFSFTREDLQHLYLVRVPIHANLGTVLNYDYLSPWGELASSAAWVLYSKDLGILALDAPYLGYTLEPRETTRQETGAPEKALKKLLDRLSGEEGIKLLSMDYVLADGMAYERDLHYVSKYGFKQRIIEPMWRIQLETGAGEEQTWLVSINAQNAYELSERCYLETVQNHMMDFFREYSALYPDADVWYSGSTILIRGEDGREYLEVQCYGVDVPELETSGFLPRGTVLDYPEQPFNQKEAHPCPHEPEWEKKYWSEEREDTVTLTMLRPVYPLYPDCVEVTVKCGKNFPRDPFSFRKYVDGEWQPVMQVYVIPMIMQYVEAGETTFQASTRSKLGPGLYRLYVNQEYWVEFQVSDAPASPSP